MMVMSTMHMYCGWLSLYSSWCRKSPVWDRQVFTY